MLGAFVSLKRRDVSRSAGYLAFCVSKERLGQRLAISGVIAGDGGAALAGGPIGVGEEGCTFRFGQMSPADQIGHALGQGQRGGVEIARCRLRHQGRINDAEAFDTADAAVGRRD